MNGRQKGVVAVGTLLAIACGLFPPYEGEYTREGDNWREPIGHYFLFAPPSQADVHRGVTGNKVPPDYRNPRCRSRIVSERYLVQIVTVIVATVGGAALLAERGQAAGGERHEDGGEIRDDSS